MTPHYIVVTCDARSRLPPDGSTENDTKRNIPSL